MPTWAWIVIIVVAAVIVVAAIAAWMQQRRRSTQLKDRFGSEYDRTVSERDDRRAAEQELAERERKRERLDIVPLSSEAQAKYSASWQKVQTQFVDDPSNAVNEADRLVTDVMRDRGYPIDNFDQRADEQDLLFQSVDLPRQLLGHGRPPKARASFRLASSLTRTGFKTVGDCPDFAQSAEQNGTVPFSETVLKHLPRFPGSSAADLPKVA